MRPRQRALRSSPSTEHWLALERRSFEIRFPRQPQAVILLPAPYPTGIANLGFLTIWRRLNAIPGFSCDRAFWDPRSKTLPRAFETGLPLSAFPLVFISSSFELDLTAVIKTFLAAGIEPIAAKRNQRDPVVVAGGFSLCSNPAPWSPVVNLALLGEGEESIEPWMSIYQDWLERQKDRRELLERSAKLPQSWIPSLPRRTVSPAVYSRYGVDPACSSAVHPEGHFGDCWLVELTRGCPRGCRFCALCSVYPARFAKAQAVLGKLNESNALAAPKIGLVGGAVGDHPALKSLAREIIESGREFTISSLRIERSDPELLELLVNGGLKTLTVAPETGSEELRRKIGKKATNEDLTQLARQAAQAGIKTLRLYFLIGLPEEEPPEEIVNLVKHLRKEAPGALKLDLSISSFIPKPGTPWERAPFADIKHLDKVKKKLRSQLRAIQSVEVHFEATRSEREAALLSRGDAALGEALVRAVEAGRPLEQEMRVSKMEAEKYLHWSEWAVELPWGFVSKHK